MAFTIHEGVLARARKFGPPTGIKFIDSNPALDVVQKLISALNWSGIASVYLRYDIQDDQVKVLEINPRYWGSLLGALSAGVNFPYYACLAGMGIPFNRPDYQQKYYLTGSATIQQSIKKFLGKSHVDFYFSDTSWKYGITDPLADFARVSRSILSKIN